MYFDEGYIGDRRRRWAAVGAGFIAAEGTTHTLCLGAVLVKLFFDLRVVICCKASLVKRLLVRMYGHECFRVDNELNEFIATSDTPEVTFRATHDVSIR